MKRAQEQHKDKEAMDTTKEGHGNRMVETLALDTWKYAASMLQRVDQAIQVASKTVEVPRPIQWTESMRRRPHVRWIVGRKIGGSDDMDHWYTAHDPPTLAPLQASLVQVLQFVSTRPSDVCSFL